MTQVLVVFKKHTRLNDLEKPVLKYILPGKEGEPYFFWWSETKFSFYPYDVVEAVQVEEVEEDGTVSHPEVPNV